MLSPGEFSVGRVSEAEPLALVLSRDEYEHTCVIGGKGADKAAVLLGSDHQFNRFDLSTLSNWSGLIIPHVGIEVDESSIFDPRAGDRHFGALIRSGDYLAITAKDEQWRGPIVIPLISDLPPLAPNHQAGFARWQIIIGVGLEKRILWSVDTMPKGSS